MTDNERQLFLRVNLLEQKVDYLALLLDNSQKKIDYMIVLLQEWLSLDSSQNKSPERLQ